jgi:Rrf2 family transcriptional regulator, iron-sulfur cluster assembly transcription factor
MKFSSQEEYGSRCLVRLGRGGAGASLTIPEISVAEGLSIPYVAKLMRILRRSGFVKSVRGQAGGYSLARPAEQIVMGDLLAALGGRLYEPEFCRHHSGSLKNCLNTTNCSIRPVWQTVQIAIDQVLNKMTLKDLLQSEQAMASLTSTMVKTVQLGGAAPSFVQELAAERNPQLVKPQTP